MQKKASTQSDSTVRLFIGSPSSAALRSWMGSYEASRQFLEGRYSGRIKWSRPEALHLTWVFLGETPERDVPEILDTLRHALFEVPTVSLHMGRVAAWPSPKKPEVLVWESDESLQHSHNLPIFQVAEHLRSAFPHLTDEQSFRPHLTLARIKAATNDWEEFPEIPAPFFPQTINRPIEWKIDTVHLYQSTLLPTGSRYDILGSFPLG